MRLILNKLKISTAQPVTLMLATLEPAPQPVRRPPEQAPLSMLLSDLSAGSYGRITQVDAHCDDLLRLQALGVCVGRRVQLVRAGDPMIISVVGARVGLSARLAAEVRVVPVAAEESHVVPLANAS
jgi:Fe2+ transport system protein FeoA